MNLSNNIFVVVVRLLMPVTIIITRSARGQDLSTLKNFAQTGPTVKHCTQEECKVTCRHGDAGSIYFHIKLMQFHENKECSIIQELFIYNYTFPDNTISKDWSPTGNDIKILKIHDSKVKEIEGKAFVNFDLLEIELVNLELQHLDNDVLVGLPNLKKLTIIQKKRIHYIENNFLKPVEKSLQHLQVSAGLYFVSNLTNGNANLTALKTLDLSKNDFGKLSPRAFIKISIVRSLNLSYSNIEHLPAYVFESVSNTLNEFDISHNLLKTLNLYVFHSILPKYGNLYLNDNPWKCRCSLQIFLKNFNVHNGKNLTCSNDEYDDIPVLATNLCQSESISDVSDSESDYKYDHNGYTTKDSLSTTKKNSIGQAFLPQSHEAAHHSSNSLSSSIDISSASDGVGTPKPGTFQNALNLKCQVCENDGAICTEDKLDYKTIIVTARQEEFSLTKFTDNSVRITLARPLKYHYSLIWFNKVTTEFYKMEINYKEYGLGCIRNVNRSVVVSDLIINSTYTFCLVRSKYKTIPPFNCQSYYVPFPSTGSHGIWLSKEMKATGICLMLLGIIFSVLLGGCIVYCVIKRKPTLLKGSKRVVTPKTSSSDIMVFPSKESILKFSNRDSPMPRRKCTFSRKQSTTSEESNVSYVSPDIYEVIPPQRTRPSTPSWLDDFPSYESTIHSSPKIYTKRMSNDPLPAIPARTTAGINFSPWYYNGSNA